MNLAEGDAQERLVSVENRLCSGVAFGGGVDLALRRERRKHGYDESMSLTPQRQDAKRKLIEFSPEIWLALELLAKDLGTSVQALADEAFTDLLRKYRRPLSLKEALRESARRLPANDDLPHGQRERS